MKTLVVYYSNSGRTRCVAEAIARELSADIEEIEEKRPRPTYRMGDGEKKGGGGIARAAGAAALGLGSGIKKATHSAVDYDMVIVGTPVWVGSVSPAARSYLKQQKKSLPQVAFFCTRGGESTPRVFKQMGALAGKEPVATASVAADDVKSGAYEAAVSSLAARLRGEK